MLGVGMARLASAIKMHEQSDGSNTQQAGLPRMETQHGNKRYDQSNAGKDDMVSPPRPLKLEPRRVHIRQTPK
jgi:hypothetical protein